MCIGMFIIIDTKPITSFTATIAWVPSGLSTAEPYKKGHPAVAHRETGGIFAVNPEISLLERI